MKFFLGYLCLFPILVLAQKSETLRIDTFPTEGMALDNDYWKWHIGDDPAWANTHFDDSQWDNINPIKQLPEIPQVLDAEICWFRLRIKVDSTLFNKPFTFFYYVLGASEVYFNGQLLKTIGVVSKDPHIEKTYITRSGLAFNSAFPNTSEMVIAIRYSLTHRNFYFPYYSALRSGPIFMSIGSVEAFNSNKDWLINGNISFFLIIGFFFGLAFIHLALYYFLPSQKANLWFGLAMLSHSIFNLHSYIMIAPQLNISFYTFITLIHNAALSLYYIFIVLAVHAYMKQPLNKQFWIVASIVFGGYFVLFTHMHPPYSMVLYESTFLVANLYYLILLRHSIKKGNKTGLVIYYSGIIGFICSPIPPLVQLGLINFNSDLGGILFNASLNIMWLSTTLGISLTLARDFARTDNSLRDKLKEVQRLSNEKQELLINQNEILEKQVIERTEALNQSLTELKETQVKLIEKEQIASAAAVRLQELDVMKTRLYTNITHEFRTPLTVILGMAQQIKDKPTEFLQEGLGMIKRNGQNLLNLINQMLDLSKLENGRLTLHYQRSDVVNFMKYLVESFHSFAQSKNVKIHFISDLEQLVMDFDETYLQQIISNLLTNAVKFTPKNGDIYVSLSIQSTTFSFKVRDTGKGISEVNLTKIFDRFYQVDDGTTRRGEGTGIGLALTRELVKLMEGSISVKSQLNKGTEFEVILPIHHIADAKTEAPALPLYNRVEEVVDEYPLSKNTENSSEKPLILIADDNVDVRTYIASCLGTDYNIIIAEDGQECESLAFEHTPDLIISDVMMPYKDGFEVCKTLKKDERTSHIPIIMLTAKADIDSKLQGLEQGADAYLMKPFVKDELLLRIKKLLELRQQLQQYYRSTISNTGTEAIKGTKTDAPSPKTSDNAFVIKVRTLIEANLNNSVFDVETLCRDLLLSPSQVHRKLTALTGLSTNNFIRYIRLVKAKEMLIQNAHFTVAAIGYDCGFSDPAYFSRAFKQEFGVTPQGWREQNGV